MELQLEIATTIKEQQEVSRRMQAIKKELHHLAHEYGETCIYLNKFIEVNNRENDEPANLFVASMDEFLFSIGKLYNYASKRLRLLEKRYNALSEELEELSEYNDDSDIPY